MASLSERLEELDLTLFDQVPSQTAPRERRSLLAVQRAVANHFGSYTYLEIGSYLGGSLQPHVLDERCRTIFSIDPRPSVAPDERSEAGVIEIEDNAVERMLELLGGLEGADLSKLRTFESDAAEVDVELLAPRPQLAFIDGEHTVSAALSDYRFCRGVLADGGAILFHDFGIIYPALEQIYRELTAARAGTIALRLEGSLCALCDNRDVINRDPYLRSLAGCHRRLPFYFLRERLKKLSPEPLVALARTLRNGLQGRRKAIDSGRIVPD